MKRFVFLFVLVACLTCQVGAAALSPSTDLQYDIKVNPEEGSCWVTLSCKAPKSGQMMIQFPQNWNKGDSYITIQHVEHCTYQPSSEYPNVIVVKSAPLATISIQYKAKNQLFSDYPDLMTPYRLAIKPSYYYIISEALFAMPTHRIEQPNTISILWHNVPASWVSVNSFTPQDPTLPIKGVLGRQFLTGIFWAGNDLRLHRFEVRQKPCYLATRGTWAFDDLALVQLLQQTINTQRDFWNDYEVPHYLVTLMPAKLENGWGTNGRSLYNSFAAVAAHNQYTNLAALRDLFNHELMHYWIGNQIINEQPETLLYWFSEGFTSYFTDYNMYRSKQIGREEYIERLNNILKKHHTSAQNTVTNQQIAQGFFGGDPQLQELPYNRGLIYALYLEGLVNQASQGKKTLKDAMQDLLRICKTEKRTLSVGLFNQVISKYVGKDISPDTEKLMVQGQLLSLDTLNQAIPDGFVNAAVKVFSLGFKTNADKLKKGGEIIEINPTSPALEAGLKLGDKLTALNYGINDYSMPCQLKVLRNNETVAVTYSPYILATVPQINPNSTFFIKPPQQP
ncbi:MAG: M1 family aminopeptidase [Spirosomataceae bacterium]